MTHGIRPFRIAISDDDIDDLRDRLARTRWPREEPVADWSQGVKTDSLRGLVAHWAQHYDWRRLESALNAHPQYLTTVDGLDIHYVHVRSPHPHALPLILTHGWPGSITEYLPLIGPLTDPVAYGGSADDAFDVVIPSLPGFGFTAAPTETGWDVDRIARAWGTLMHRLGYTRWAAHGGDWGGAVTTALGAQRPAGLVGIHLSTPYVVPERLPDTPTPEERQAMDGLAFYAGPLGGSNHLQGTKPQTVAFALADSPVGHAAWIYEKYQSKTDNQGRAEDAIAVDAMLDVISYSWFTNSAGSSARIYWDNRAATMSGPRLELPVAVTVFPRDIPLMPRSWIETAFPNLLRCSLAPAGGHFVALEQPEILVDEVRVGLRGLRAR